MARIRYLRLTEEFVIDIKSLYFNDLQIKNTSQIYCLIQFSGKPTFQSIQFRIKRQAQALHMNPLPSAM